MVRTGFALFAAGTLAIGMAGRASAQAATQGTWWNPVTVQATQARGRPDVVAVRDLFPAILPVLEVLLDPVGEPAGLVVPGLALGTLRQADVHEVVLQDVPDERAVLRAEPTAIVPVVPGPA